MTCKVLPGGYENEQELIESVYDVCKGIKDPEKPQTLEELGVVNEEDIYLKTINDDTYVIQVFFTPTVPHCQLAAFIGLCLKLKLQQSFPDVYKIDIAIKKGKHDSYQQLNKQLGDKERLLAALENSSETILQCIQD